MAIGIYSILHVRNLNIQDLGISVGFGIKSPGHQSLTVRTQSRNGVAGESRVPMRVLEENKSLVPSVYSKHEIVLGTRFHAPPRYMDRY